MPGTVHREGPLGSWAVTPGLPAPALRGYVLGYTGYTERTTFTRRREVPTGYVPMIINLGPDLRVGGETHELGFVAGLADSADIVDSGGEQSCIQVNFTPVGAALLLGRPLGGLVNTAASLPELFGPAAGELVGRLHDEPSWARRFALLDGFVADRFAAATGVPPDLVWAWRRLTETGGALPVAALAAELGCSRKHLTARFTGQLGLPPKTLARILRFHSVVGELERGRPVRLADVASRHGYADQAHLTREFRALAGLTPGEHARRVRPGLGLIEG